MQQFFNLEQMFRHIRTLIAVALLLCISGCTDEEDRTIDLLSPPNGANVFFEDLNFSWTTSDSSCPVMIFVSTDSQFTAIIDTITCSTNSCTASAIQKYKWNTQYYWKAVSICGAPAGQSGIYSFFLIDTRDSIIGNYTAVDTGYDLSIQNGIPDLTEYADTVLLSISKDSTTGVIIDCNCLHLNFWRIEGVDNDLPLVPDSGSCIYSRGIRCEYLKETNQILLTTHFSGSSEDWNYSFWDTIWITK